MNGPVCCAGKSGQTILITYRKHKEANGHVKHNLKMTCFSLLGLEIIIIQEIVHT